MKYFRTIFTGIILLLILLFINILSLNAADTVIVNTFNLDGITMRRGLFQFPDNNDTYRKIIMLYTLKCDSRTTQDGYSCGEWDYLTYNMVYNPTGKMKVDTLRHPLLKIGSEAPAILKYTMDTTYSKFSRFDYFIKYNSITSENEYSIGNGTKDITLETKPFRYQFIITKDELRNLGFSPGNIDRLKLYIKNPGNELKNFTIKMKVATQKELTEFDNSALETAYSRNLKFESEGWQTIDLTYPFRWNGFSNLLVDLSYESKSGNTATVLQAHDAGKSVVGTIEGNYLLFDGKNDYIDCGNIAALNNTQEFTLEAWVKLDGWSGNNVLLGEGSDIALITHGTNGRLICAVKNPNNTFGYSGFVINQGEWTHLAMVYDGTGAKDADKLKLYVNGKLQTMDFSANIPTITPVTDLPFTISSAVNTNNPTRKAIREVRLWSAALSGSTIKDWMYKNIDESHPNKSGLISNYLLNEGQGTVAADNSGNNKTGAFFGGPAWKYFTGNDIQQVTSTLNLRPDCILIRGDYISHLDSLIVTDTINNSPVSVVKYGIVDGKPQIKEISYAWKAGFVYNYLSGKIIDSTYFNSQFQNNNDSLTYYSAPYPIKENYEIGRFITPYGINLDLGPEGFTWSYDVTDYAPLLKGLVDFSAGNQQELIDIKFLMIKGIPPRNVLKIDKIWGPMRSISYKNLSDDKELSSITLPLLPDAAQFKVKTRLTGHGHNSNDGNFPHCCEWKDNIHTLFVNGYKVSDWHIFQYDDCALNPVFPQGGTWPGSREGWCPGDVVKDNEFEITNFMSGDSVTLDYDITKVPSDNQGMGSGNYVVSMEIFQYSEPNFENDAEIYDVITPNEWDYYSRKNPICSEPTIIVRNNGNEAITSLKIKYGVSPRMNDVYNWSGNIPPMEKATISLPISGGTFWFGDGKCIFTAQVSEPNGKQDNYAENDTYSTHFVIPDMYKEKPVIWFQTNRRSQDFYLEVKDIQGNVVLSRTNLSNETLYVDSLNFPDGCYTLEVIDQNNYGLSYWAFTEQGTGFLRIHNKSGTALKVFNPDFGHGVKYSFYLGDVNYIKESNYDDLIAVFPNPASQNINIVLNYFLGKSVIKIFDVQGNLIRSENDYIDGDYQKTIDMKNSPAGTYFINITNDKFNITKKFIVK